MCSTCYNCNGPGKGPVCDRCWRKLTSEEREDIKNVFNDEALFGKHGDDAQMFCDVPGCWNGASSYYCVRKVAGEWEVFGRCIEHPEDGPRARSRSPVVRPADRPVLRPAARRGASAASCHRPATPPTADRMKQGIARLRAGIEMMQNAVNEIADAASRS